MAKVIQSVAGFETRLVKKKKQVEPTKGRTAHARDRTFWGHPARAFHEWRAQVAPRSQRCPREHTVVSRRPPGVPAKRRREAPGGPEAASRGGTRAHAGARRRQGVCPQSPVASESGAADAMMDEPWWEGRVASDVHCTLREKELKLPTFRAHSPLLKSRRFFVNILTLLSSHCQLCPAARHLAVYLLDHFLDRYDITTSKQLYAVAVSCLLLAI
nr:PREDICTED: cyclin-J-like protein [Bos indicus]